MNKMSFAIFIWYCFCLLITNCYCSTLDEQYLNLVCMVLDHGESRNDRTGTGTLSLFAPPPIVMDVSHDAFPIITTKKVNFRLIAEELFWMIGGSSSVTDLQKKKVYIWNANANREGRAGFYGTSWRFFGANYSPDIESMKAQKHADQIANAIHLIMNEPHSRRIFISAWHALDIAEHPDVLPPCHVSMQFYVRNKDTLDMQFYQRSVDLAIGFCFNISSYSLLLLLLAHVTDKKPGKITYMMGDTHLYKNTIDPIRPQIQKTPFQLPQLQFEFEKGEEIPRGSGMEGLLRFNYKHLKLKGYESHPPIQMIMSA